jgi:hypothetical protein
MAIVISAHNPMPLLKALMAFPFFRNRAIPEPRGKSNEFPPESSYEEEHSRRRHTRTAGRAETTRLKKVTILPDHPTSTGYTIMKAEPP